MSCPQYTPWPQSLQKGLKLLRERLVGESDETKISDSTISVALKLASAAQFNGEFQTAKKTLGRTSYDIGLKRGAGRLQRQ